MKGIVKNNLGTMFFYFIDVYIFVFFINCYNKTQTSTKDHIHTLPPANELPWRHNKTLYNEKHSK